MAGSIPKLNPVLESAPLLRRQGGERIAWEALEGVEVVIPNQIVRRSAYGLLLGPAGPDSGHRHVGLHIALPELARSTSIE